MIPNIVRGSDPAGLVRYLFGKGRRNEHTDQHLVCASGDMFPSFDMDGKPAASYAEIGRRFDRRYRVRERKDDPFPPDMRGKNNPEREHGRKRVWHCSLAIKAGHGILTDQEWEAVIRDYLTRMNIIDGDDDQGVTWLAVRHGLSANGNDHVHIMVQLAADDGWINPYHDRINAQKSCRRMEKSRPELVELARSDTGTRVSWQYGQWRQWAEWKARNEYGDDEGWDALDGNERSRLVTAVAASRCHANTSPESWRRAPRHRAARTSSYAACAGKASPSTPGCAREPPKTRSPTPARWSATGSRGAARTGGRNGSTPSSSATTCD